MDDRVINAQWKIGHAIQRLHRKYNKNPWIFMTEADIQCNLFAELMASNIKPIKSKVFDYNDKKVVNWEYEILTRSLHAELSSTKRKATEYVDLCLVEPKEVWFWIKKRQFDKTTKNFPIWEWSWLPRQTIGIEIKFNRWISKIHAHSNITGRERITKKWKNFENTLVRDLKKLKSYKRGWLIFVDQYSLFETRTEWRDFVDLVVRRANYGRDKKTLNAYYMCPKAKVAFSYKPPGSSSHLW